jgi:hypothetical protein
LQFSSNTDNFANMVSSITVTPQPKTAQLQ